MSVWLAFALYLAARIFVRFTNPATDAESDHPHSESLAYLMKLLRKLTRKAPYSASLLAQLETEITQHHYLDQHHHHPISISTRRKFNPAATPPSSGRGGGGDSDTTTSPPGAAYPLWFSSPSTSSPPDDRASSLIPERATSLHLPAAPTFTTTTAVPPSRTSGQYRPSMTSRVSSTRNGRAGSALNIDPMDMNGYDEAVS